MLSQAFKNRFLIMHVDDIPSQELEEILVKRTKIEPRFAKVLVKVKTELERRRQRSNVFSGKRGFITPRDLLRWAHRISIDIEDDVFRFEEDDQSVPQAQKWACVGFSLLGERLRRNDERKNLCTLLENTCRYSAKIVVEPEMMYGTDDVPSPVRRYLSEKKKKYAIETNKRKRERDEEEKEDTSLNGMCLEGIAWTKSMRRLFRLSGDCLKHSEPALLVGATAAGKTTVCQIWAQILGRKLHVVSCHRNTEASDIIGGLHPIRDRSGHSEELINSVRDLVKTIRHVMDAPPSKRTRRVEEDLSESTDTDSNAMTPQKKKVGILTDMKDLPVLGEHVTVEYVVFFVFLCSRVLDSYHSLNQSITHSNIQNSLTQTYNQHRYALQVAEMCGALKRKPAGLLRDATEQDESLVSCHRRFRSALRTYRSLFEWYDGPLLKAMKNGDILLLDELNTASDAVLERLNSVLEPGRSILLSEKGSEDADENVCRVVAHPNFRILATMNPSGDYGKRELSPALRNRFTEIWVPPVRDPKDLQSIATHHCRRRCEENEVQIDKTFVNRVVEFSSWFDSITKNDRLSLTLRDILSWIDFLVLSVKKNGNTDMVWWSFLHGAAIVLDGLATATDLDLSEANRYRKLAFEYLIRPLVQEQQGDLAKEILHSVLGDHTTATTTSTKITMTKRLFGIKPFLITRGPNASQSDSVDYAFDAPTTRHNLVRLLRALQLERRPILLEGSPGVGKTSLVVALGKLSGHHVTRINLSDQTDLSDLFGADLPCTSEESEDAMFKWVDGALLRAMRTGGWALIDEINLASQPVLEGLNALFDHRRTVFIPAIGKSFECHPSFRCFACQNPLHEGGGRKGLPKSFVNRFSRVYVSALMREDILTIARALRPVPSNLENLQVSCEDALEKIVRFNSTFFFFLQVSCHT